MASRLQMKEEVMMTKFVTTLIVGSAPHSQS